VLERVAEADRGGHGAPDRRAQGTIRHSSGHHTDRGLRRTMSMQVERPAQVERSAPVGEMHCD